MSERTKTLVFHVSDCNAVCGVAEWSSISDVICWVALCSFFLTLCCCSFFFLPSIFNLFFPSSIFPSSKLLFPSSQLPGLLFPPLFVLTLPAFDALLLLSCRLPLSLTLLLPFKPLFLFILSFLIPILPSPILSSVSHYSPVCSSFLPLYPPLAYALQCSSIYSTHCLLWLLLSSVLPSSPVINCCYWDSTPKKCQHGSLVWCPFIHMPLYYSRGKANNTTVFILPTDADLRLKHLQQT